jgi:hypothetical protein
VTSLYWATLTFYCWIIGGIETDHELRQNALAKLTHLLYVYYDQEDGKIRQARVVWPTFMAVIETKDPTHRSFLFGKLKEFRQLTSECSRLYSIAEEIMKLQDDPGNPRIDLAVYMKSPFTSVTAGESTIVTENRTVLG